MRTGIRNHEKAGSLENVIQVECHQQTRLWTNKASNEPSPLLLPAHSVVDCSNNAPDICTVPHTSLLQKFCSQAGILQGNSSFILSSDEHEHEHGEREGEGGRFWNIKERQRHVLGHWF